jgi:predicted secreted protein
MLREIFMRKIAMLFLLALSAVSMYAGDIATFVSLGFSPDGARYAFGQYGVTDTEFTAYADVWSVDVAKNEFIPGGVFSAKPAVQSPQSGADAKTDAVPVVGSGAGAQDGRALSLGWKSFTVLGESSSSYLKKIGIDNALQGRALYVLSDSEPSLKTITFRDFETGNSWEVTLNSLVEGKDAKARSSFYLVASVTGSDGKVIRKTIGLPGFKREGVLGYRVRRIISDDSGKSLVFVIEKDLYQPKGSSVRFMVETARF